MILFLLTLFYTAIPNAASDSSYPQLCQSYTYLGEGAQMIAYASEDGQYVLKLFKAHHKRPFKWKYLFKTKAAQLHSQEKWQQKFTATCRRYEMAFTHLKEETGLVTIHFEKTKTPIPAKLKHRVSHSVDLSQLPFVIQKKALLAPDYFKQNPHLKEEGKEALKAFFAKRLSKGFSDPRQTLSKNYGFIGHTPIQIDPGKLEPFDQDPQAELTKIYHHIDEWLLRFAE